MWGIRLFALVLAFVVPAIQAQTTRRITDAPVLYEIRIADITSNTIKAYDTGKRVFVPLIPLLELTGFPYAIDSIRMIAQFNKQTFELSQPNVFWHQDTVYVLLRAVVPLLGIDAIVDRVEAAITLTNTASLPVVRRFVRTAARAALELQASKNANADFASQKSKYESVHTPPSAWGNLLLDYSIIQQRTRITSGTNAIFGVGTPIGAGSLVARFASIGNMAEQRELTWSAVWPESHELKQLRFGSSQSSGLTPLPIRGIYLSSAPYARVSTFNQLALTGALPPDWSIEAYRNGTLIGFDSIGAAGRYMLSVPVQYGENPFELIAYSPSGETVRFGQMIRTQPSMLPSGAFEFSASTGACTTRQLVSPCAWMMDLDLRYGLSPRWTIRGGATEYTWRNTKAVNVYPYVALAGVPTQGLTLNAEFLRSGHTQFGLSWDPSRQFTLIGDYTRYSATDVGAMLANNIRTQLWMLTRFTPSALQFPLEAQLTRIVSTSNAHTFLRTGTSIAFNSATLRPYLRSIRDNASHTVSTGIEAIMSGVRIGLPAWSLRSTIESNTLGSLSYAELMFFRNNLFGFSGEAGLRWYANSRPSIAFSFTTDFGQIRAQTYTTSSLRGHMESLQHSYSGSLRWDANARRLIRSADPNLDRAGISGIVFLDLNGNGTLDSDEPLIPNTSLRVDETTVVTNSSGYYELWGVAPGRIISVSVDTATLESPWWIPTKAVHYVAASPNRAISLNIPIVSGGIIEGSVVVGDSCTFPTSFTIKHRASSRTYTIVPFSDGTFYQMGLLPGPYDLLSETRSRSSCTLSAATKNITITPNQTTTVEVTLTRNHL